MSILFETLGVRLDLSRRNPDPSTRDVSLAAHKKVTSILSYIEDKTRSLIEDSPDSNNQEILKKLLETLPNDDQRAVPYKDLIGVQTIASIRETEPGKFCINESAISQVLMKFRGLIKKPIQVVAENCEITTD
ncbi:MAG: hypothetical protein KDD56_04480 [Bdellovibrionales bacterium]|nr:hypothetical protein [Bdellovibrionales bacterium]